MDFKNLSNNWEVKILEDLLVKKEAGKRPKGGVSKYKSGTPSIGAEHLTGDGGFDFTNVKFVPDDFADSMNRGKIKSGDFIVVKDGATTGKISLVKENFPFENAVVNEHVILCNVDDRVHNKYIFYYLWSETGKKQILNDFRGAAQGGISQKFSKKVQVPLPPLSTQHRIVEKIEELFSDLDNGLQNLKKAKQQLETYKQSVLKAAFEGKLTKHWREQQEDLPTPEELRTQSEGDYELYREKELSQWCKDVKQWEEEGEPGKKPWKPRKRKELDPISNEEINKAIDIPDNWAYLRLQKLGKEIFDGPFGSKLKTKDYKDEGVRVIRLENIDWLNFKNEHKTYVSEEKYQEIKKHTVYHRDIIFASFISDSTRVTVLPKVIEKAVNKADCFCVRTFDSVNPYYLCFYLATSHGYNQLSHKVHGATRPRVNTTQLKETAVPVCSKEEQDQVVNEIESRFSIIDKLDKTISDELGKAKALRQSILKKAFEGKLIREAIQQEEVSVVHDQELTPFQQIQMIGILIEILEEEFKMTFGEMALAKYLYLIDRIKSYRTGFKYKDWHWGPYDPDMKSLIHKKSGFFQVNQNSAIQVKNDKHETLLKYNLPEQKTFESGIRELSQIISKFKGKKSTSRQLELLATVCKVVENEQSTDLKVVREGMKKWKTEKTKYKNKAEKFSEEETKRCLEFILGKEWEDNLINR